MTPGVVLQQVHVHPPRGTDLARLDGVSLQVAPGTIVAVLGSPADGAATLARVLTAKLPDGTTHSGRVRVAGKDPQAADALPDQLAAYVGPRPVLHPRHTFGRQLGDALLHAGFERRDIDRRTGALLRAVGLGSGFGATATRSTALERHRIDLALALATGAQVLVAERFGEECDTYVRSELRSLLREACEYLGLAVLVLTQDVGGVADLADRVLVLENGQLSAEASVRSFFAAPPTEHARALIAAAPRLTLTETTSGRAAVAQALRRVRAEEAQSAQRELDVRSRRAATGSPAGEGADLADTPEDAVVYSAGADGLVIDLDHVEDGAHAVDRRRAVAATSTEDPGTTLSDAPVDSTDDAMDAADVIDVEDLGPAAVAPTGTDPEPTRGSELAAALDPGSPAADLAPRPGIFARLFGGARRDAPQLPAGPNPVTPAPEAGPALLEGAPGRARPNGTGADGLGADDTGADGTDADGVDPAGVDPLEAPAPVHAPARVTFSPEGVDLADSHVPRAGRHAADPDPDADGEPAAPVLEIHHLRLTRRGSRLRGADDTVADLNLTLRRGETLAVLGTSGAGTSALLRAIHGLESPSGGSIKVLGQAPRSIPSAGAVQPGRSALVLPDSVEPGSQETVRAHLEAALKQVLTGHAETDLHFRVARLLEDVGLPREIEAAPLGSLSPRERCVVALAAALAGSPALLLLDEPALGLDAVDAAAYARTVRAVQDRRRLTVVVAGHDPAQLAAVAERVVVMDAGRVVETGVAAEVLGAPVAPATERLVLSVPVPNPLLQARRRELRAARLAARAAADA